MINRGDVPYQMTSNPLKTVTMYPSLSARHARFELSLHFFDQPSPHRFLWFSNDLKGFLISRYLKKTFPLSILSWPGACFELVGLGLIRGSPSPALRDNDEVVVVAFMNNGYITYRGHDQRSSTIHRVKKRNLFLFRELS